MRRRDFLATTAAIGGGLVWPLSAGAAGERPVLIGTTPVFLDDEVAFLREWQAYLAQQLQRVLFPEGLPFDGTRFGTAVTCLAFRQLAENGRVKSNLASPTPDQGAVATNEATAGTPRIVSVMLPRAA